MLFVLKFIDTYLLQVYKSAFISPFLSLDDLNYFKPIRILESWNREKKPKWSLWCTMMCKCFINAKIKCFPSNTILPFKQYCIVTFRKYQFLTAFHTFGVKSCIWVTRQLRIDKDESIILSLVDWTIHKRHWQKLHLK